MIELKGQEGELAFTVSITRKDTGKTEEYQLVGRITEDQLNELTQENTNGCNP